MSLFIVNYGRELRMEVDIRRKEKVERVMEFVKKIWKSSGRSRSSIEKSIRGDEVIDR